MSSLRAGSSGRALIGALTALSVRNALIFLWDKLDKQDIELNSPKLAPPSASAPVLIGAHPTLKSSCLGRPPTASPPSGRFPLYLFQARLDTISRLKVRCWLGEGSFHPGCQNPVLLLHSARFFPETPEEPNPFTASYCFCVETLCSASHSPSPRGFGPVYQGLLL